MQPHQSHGVWDGQNSYSGILKQAQMQGSVTILTSAKLKFKNIPDFWKRVRPVNTVSETQKEDCFLL